MCGGAWTLAVMGALTIPDTCGVLREPTAGVGERYRHWYDDYAAEAFDTGNPATSLSAEDCYQLRCGLLHENTQVFRKVTGAATRIIFTAPGGGLVLNQCLNGGCPGAPHSDILREHPLCPAPAWETAEGGDPAVVANSANVVRLHPGGIPPYVGGYPMLG